MLNKKSFSFANLIIAILTLVVALIIMLSASSQFYMENKIGTPLKIISYNIATGISNTAKYIVFGDLNDKQKIENLTTQNNQLIQENVKLTLALGTLKQIELDNKHLKEALDFKNDLPKNYKYLSTNIIAGYTSSINSYILINGGKNYKVSPKSLVISPSGVVGFVNKVSASTSSVISVNSPDFKILAKTEQSNYNVVLFGTQNNFLEVKAYTENYTFIEGEAVYTSSVQNDYPKNILIGYVAKINNQFIVVPSYNIKHSNEYIFIVN